MGAYGPGNLDNDSGHDAVCEITGDFIKRIDEMLATQIDEYDLDWAMGYIEAYKEYVKVMPMGGLPTPEKVTAWRERVLAVWDGGEIKWPSRREVLVETFEELDGMSEPEIPIPPGMGLD